MRPPSMHLHGNLGDVALMSHSCWDRHQRVTRFRRRARASHHLGRWINVALGAGYLRLFSRVNLTFVSRILYLLV
jgi:hypothetical protein